MEYTVGKILKFTPEGWDGSILFSAYVATFGSKCNYMNVGVVEYI